MSTTNQPKRPRGRPSGVRKPWAVPVSGRVSPAVAADLATVASLAGCTPSKVVARAVEEYCRRVLGRVP